MGVHLLKGAIRGGWRKEWLELSTTTKKRKKKKKRNTSKGEWLNWLLCLLTGHGNHSRLEIQRRGLVNPVTQSTKDG